MNLYAFLWVALSMIAFVALLELLSQVFYRRTFIATLVELYLKLTKPIKPDSVVNAELQSADDKLYELPKKKFKSEYVCEEFEGIPIFRFNPTADKSKAVIYLHGAGYVRKPRSQHWGFWDRLAQKTQVQIIVPIYLKAPKHNYKEAYDKLTRYYEGVRKEYESIILMGDSSGGGLALGLCEYWAKIGVAQPNKMILISPWVDITFSNADTAEYQKVDPFISVAHERLWRLAWADDLDPANYLVSPYFGDVKALNDVTLFVGTREVLFPQVNDMYLKLCENGVRATLVIGWGMNHVYPIYPIPEAKKTLRTITDLITNA